VNMRLKVDGVDVCLRGHSLTPDNLYEYKKSFPRKDGTFGISRQCRQCNIDQAALWRKNNPERNAVAHLKSQRRPEAKRAAWVNRIWKLYKLTPAQYKALLDGQDSRCAICRSDDPNGPHRIWQIDHDHSSGRVRGILCNRCNLTIGRFDDDPGLLEAAAAYLRAAQS
jgi:Recombination endonuclease VII